MAAERTVEGSDQVSVLYQTVTKVTKIRRRDWRSKGTARIGERIGHGECDLKC